MNSPTGGAAAIEAWMRDTVGSFEFIGRDVRDHPDRDINVWQAATGSGRVYVKHLSDPAAFRAELSFLSNTGPSWGRTPKLIAHDVV